MKLERLSEKNKELYARAIRLYQSAFPYLERRDDAEQERVLKKGDYHFDLILDGDEFVGIMLYWELPTLIFLEHFATETALRNKGYGTRALDLLKQKGKPILLEIEVPCDQLTNRRFEFYKRNGFVLNGFSHVQAKYHADDEDLLLKVLSFPKPLEDAEYQAFYRYMLEEIQIPSK